MHDKVLDDLDLLFAVGLAFRPVPEDCYSGVFACLLGATADRLPEDMCSGFRDYRYAALTCCLAFIYNSDAYKNDGNHNECNDNW